jgi:hypothetical protein
MMLLLTHIFALSSHLVIGKLLAQSVIELRPPPPLSCSARCASQHCHPDATVRCLLSSLWCHRPAPKLLDVL